MKKINVQEILKNNNFLSGTIRSCLFDDSNNEQLIEMIKLGGLKIKEISEPESSVEFIYANSYNGFVLICSLTFVSFNNCKNGVGIQYRFEFSDKFDNISQFNKLEYSNKSCRKDLEFINSDSSMFECTLQYIRTIFKIYKSYILEDRKSYYNSRKQERLNLFQKFGDDVEKYTLSLNSKEMTPYIKWYQNKSRDEHYYYKKKLSFFEKIKRFFI